MSRHSHALAALPQAHQDSLRALGEHIGIARRRQRLTRDGMAVTMGVNVETLARLERGDPKVSLGIAAAALAVLGFTPDWAGLADPAHDREALRMEIDRLGARAPRSETRRARYLKPR